MIDNNTIYTIENIQDNKNLVINVGIELLTDLSKLDKDKTYLIGVDILNQSAPDDIKYGLEVVSTALKSKGYNNVVVYSTNQFKIKEPIEGTKEDLAPINKGDAEE